MLVITRKVRQAVVIGTDVTVVVLGFQGQQVKLGIKAPKSVLVLREEIADRGRPEKVQQT